jgi:hypothetical protein
MFIGIAQHEATSSAISKVCHERNVKSYEYWNALSLGVWSFRFVVLTDRPVGSFHSKTNSAAGLVIIMLCVILWYATNCMSKEHY